MQGRYDEVYTQSLQDPEAFWAKAAEDVTWYKKWDRIFDSSEQPLFRWFSGGVVNTCYNALDVHIENGRGDQLALIYDSPVTGTIKQDTARFMDLLL